MGAMGATFFPAGPARVEWRSRPDGRVPEPNSLALFAGFYRDAFA